MCKGIITSPHTAMATTRRKKTKPIIQRGIPAGPSETVTNREFSKRPATSRLIATTSVSSSRSSTPLASKTADEHCDDPTEMEFYSDVDEELLGKAREKQSKGSSRSVSVSESGSFAPYSKLTNDHQTLLEEFAREYESEFMDEWARLESSPQLTCLPECTFCATPGATFRCIDCFAESLFCQKCLSSLHRREPFHHLQVARDQL